MTNLLLPLISPTQIYYNLTSLLMPHKTAVENISNCRSKAYPFVITMILSPSKSLTSDNILHHTDLHLPSDYNAYRTVYTTK